MKFFHLYRLGWKNACNVVLAYGREKIFRRSLKPEQKILIAYYNILINYDLLHNKAFSDYNIVTSRKYGAFALRKPLSSDAKVYEQVFHDLEYEALGNLILKHIPGDEVTMIDGGANIGLTSIFIQQYIRADKKLSAVLIEPSEENIRIIRKNLALQHMEHFVVEKAGLYNKSGYLEIVPDFRDKLEWSIQVAESDVDTGIPAMEISEITKKYKFTGPDVLKLDIEGAEKYLFMDANYAASFLKNVKIIAIELHKEYVDEKDVLKILSDNDFILSRSGEMQLGVKKEMKTQKQN